LGAGVGAAAAVADDDGGTTSGDVAITAVADNVGNPDNGSVNLSAGGLTNDNTPTLTGRAPAGSVVTIRDGDAVLGTTTADANGAWSFTPAALAEGNHSFTATAAVAGSPVTSAAFAIVIDTVTPTIAVSVPKTSLATGEVVTVTFTLSEASTDFVLGDITAVGGTLSNLQGSGVSYTATFTPNAGSTSAMVFVDSGKFRDAAGNFNNDGAEGNNTVSFSVGTGTNKALAITSITDNLANTPEGAAINIAAGGLTNDNTPTVNGTAPAGSVVTIRDGSTVLGSATANAQGVWSFTPTALAEGAHSLSASTTVNGATTNAGPFAFTLDTSAPTIAMSVDKTSLANGETATLSFTLSEPSTDFQASDITSPSGAITNLQGVPGTGNASTGFTQYTATFTPHAGVTSAAIVVSSDRFSDAAGNLNKDGGDSNNAVSLAISPANSLISIDSASDNVGNPNNVVQPISNGGQTNDTTPTLTGKAPAGAVVTLREGSVVLGTTTANANGAWSFTPAALAEGAHSVVASFVANGVTNTSNAYSLTVDTAAPTVRVTADKAALLNAGETATVFFELSESSADLSNADIVLSGGTLSTLQGVPGTGNATSGFMRYAATFTKTATTGTAAASVSVASDKFSDASGNFNQDGADTDNTWTFNGTNTTTTTIGNVTDNVGNPNGAVQPIANGGQTNDTTPTFSGRGTPGEVVTIKDGNTVVGSTTVNPDGTWSFTAPGQGEGAHSYTASTPSGGTSAPFTLTVDTQVPVATVTLDPLTADNKIDAADASQTNLPVTGKVEGEFMAGDVVTVTVNGKPFTGTVQANGSFRVDVPQDDLIKDPDTKYEVSVALRDAAGNLGTATKSNDYSVEVVDTTPPTVDISSNQASLSTGQTATITFLLSEASSDFTWNNTTQEGDITVTGGTLGALTQDTTNPLKYTAVFTPAVNSTVNGVIEVEAGKFKDAANNVNTTCDSITLTVNTSTTPPPAPSLVVNNDAQSVAEAAWA
jgi:hypothetical protein